MGVRIITDIQDDRSAIYDSTCEWALGPIFLGDECEQQAEAFLRWFQAGAAKRTAGTATMQAFPFAGRDGYDPRDFTAYDLKRLWEHFLGFAVDENGRLHEIIACNDCGRWCAEHDRASTCTGCGSANTSAAAVA